MLLEEPETLDAVLRKEEEEGAKVEAEKKSLARTHHVHRRVTNRGWGRRLCCGLEAGGLLGGHQNPHGIQPRGL